MSDATATAERDERTSPEALLAPLLRADFFLTDGRGLVTRWGARPARAFAREAEDVVGRPAFEAVVSGAEGWVRYLAGEGEPPHPRVEATAVGEDFPVELLVLPVPLSESLEMSRLLEAMAPDLTPHERLDRMGRDHPAALERVSARAEGSPWDSDRLAGLVVAYTAPEREAQAAPPPPPAVGESEERLSRLGELEHQMADLLELRGEIAALREQSEAALALAEQALALAEHRADAASAAGPEREQDSSPRPVREGLDDTDEPRAVISLDGRYEAINAAFEALVGYPEADFRRARWPSVTDRERLADHRATLTRLVTGDIEEAPVETVYMHGQGLTVPVKGVLELVRSDDGSPDHLLLSVDG